MKNNNGIFFLGLTAALLLVMVCAIAFGAVDIAPGQMLSALTHWLHGEKPANMYEGVFLQLRLPRVLLCMITGAVLAASGVLMQGLFRNPIVEPGLVGTSAGAAFGASLVFVLAGMLPLALQQVAGTLLVPLFAFLGGLLATFMVYMLAKGNSRINVTTLLLIGIAINAVGLSGTGFLSYIARDPQARSITFWNLGTFSGAAWWQVGTLGTLAAIVFVFAMRSAKKLNAMLLGEDEALYAGVNPEKLKRQIMLLNTAIVSVATAFVGVIGFMGLIIPHLMRIFIGSDNRKLLPASMLCGAMLLTVADMGARLLLAPAEIPIGIITALTGAPVFILLLKRMHILQTKGGGYD